MSDELPIFPDLDPVQPASEMGLSFEQVNWLIDIARPRCCHNSGDHDPRHFAEHRFVCQDQLANVAYRLRVALGCTDILADHKWYRSRRVDPFEAIKRGSCANCEVDDKGSFYTGIREDTQ